MDDDDDVAVDRAMARVASMFNMTFPPAAFLALTYVGLGDAVFGIWRVVGRGLPPRLRGLLRRLFLALSTTVGALLHGWMLRECRTASPCTDRPLARRGCMIAASSAVLCVAVVLLIDRCAVPMLALDRHAAFGSGVRARVFRASVVCVVWRCLAEGETSGVALLLAATAHRGLGAWAPALLTRIYIGLLKTYTALHTFWVLRDDGGCRCGSRRMLVAVLGAMLAV